MDIMKQFSGYLYRRSNLWLSLILTVLMVLYAALVMGSRSECITVELPEGVSLLGLRFGYNYRDAAELFGYLSRDALECYSRLLRIWDNLFPFLYGGMYMAWISLIYKNIRLRSNHLALVNLFPLVPMLADLVENLLENALVRGYAETGQLAKSGITAASAVTAVKWSLSTLNYLIILTGITLLVVERGFRKRT
jgi:hypothetical protein